MLGSFKNIFWAIVAIVIVLAVLLFVLPRLGGVVDDVPASAQCFRDALPDSEKFINLSGPLKLAEGEPAVWVIFFQDQEGPNAHFVQGAVYRTASFSDRLPPAFLLWHLGAGQEPLNLGEVKCWAEGRDVLATSQQIDPTEIVIWGDAAAQKLPTRMNLFYRASEAGRDISQLYYEHHRAFIGERGIYFHPDDPQTLVVQRTITWTVGAGTQTLAQTALCRQQQYTPANGDYPPAPQVSRVTFMSNQLPPAYPQYPEEVAVAYCLQHANEGERKKYLAPNVAPPSLGGASGGLLGGLSCMAAAPPAVAVLDLTRPTTQDGNDAQVYTRLQVGGEAVPRTVIWHLRYLQIKNTESAPWQWYITGISL